MEWPSTPLALVLLYSLERACISRTSARSSPSSSGFDEPGVRGRCYYQQKPASVRAEQLGHSAGDAFAPPLVGRFARLLGGPGEGGARYGGQLQFSTLGLILGYDLLAQASTGAHLHHDERRAPKVRRRGRLHCTTA